MILSPFIYKNGDKKEGNQLGSYTTQFKLTVPDGKNEFQFAMAQFLPEKLRKIKAMPDVVFVIYTCLDNFSLF